VTILVPTTAQRTHPSAFVRDVTTITGRNLCRLFRVPTLLAFATVQPVMLVILFNYALGGAIHPPGVARYIDFLLPGLFVVTIGFGSSQTGVAMADDLANGMIDRFRSLPMRSSAVVVGRMAADAVRNLSVLLLMTGVAAAIGFRFHAGTGPAIAAVSLAVGTGLAFSALDSWLGLVVAEPEAAGLAGLFPFILLMFTSSILVPISTMPGWLQAFAKVNPVTVLTDALRALCLGGPTLVPVLQACAWILALVLLGVAGTALRFRQVGGR
jgi:ABC transporter DrrB family efflux protein